MFTFLLLPYLLLGLNFWNSVGALPQTQTHELIASREINMNLRYPNSVVNDVFAKNILLAVDYIRNDSNEDKVSIENASKPFTYTFELKPNETFVFHDKVLAEYKNKNIVKSTYSSFGYEDGYLTSGLLYGDGVCHLASLMKWVASDAGLEVNAPTNHDFRAIPEIPREYGVSIYYDPSDYARSAYQNLYITNNKDTSVYFVFIYDGTVLKTNVLLNK